MHSILSLEIRDFGSLTSRLEYNYNALMLLYKNPIAIFVGHPDGILMYTGDGYLTAIVVTYGLPIFTYFAIVNIFLILKGIRSKRRDLKLCGYIILMVFIFMIFNRINDYWPCAFAYYFAISYLATMHRSIRYE